MPSPRPPPTSPLPPPLPGAPPPPTPPPPDDDGDVLHLRVSIAGADPPLALTVPPTSSLAALQAEIARLGALPPGTRLRLIHAGKLLGGGAGSVSAAGLADGSFLHVGVSAPPGGGGHRGVAAAPRTRRLRLGVASRWRAAALAGTTTTAACCRVRTAGRKIGRAHV